MNAKQYNKNLPEFLHRSDEQLKAEKSRQDNLRPSTFNYSEDVVLYNRALVDEATATEALAILETLGDTPENLEAFLFNRLKLAEAYLEQGLFQLAFNYHPDERYRGFLKKIVDAGEKTCPHPLNKNFVEQRGNERFPTQIPNFRLWRMVFNGSADKFISIFVCNICKSIWRESD